MPAESVPEPVRRAHLYLVALDEEATIRKSREDHREYLRGWIREVSEPDEDGNYTYEFPSPIFGVRGLQLQRRVSEFVDDDKAFKVIDKHGLHERCIKQVISYKIDYDELYACNQQGIISDEEIDSILEFSETYALVKVKA